MKEIFCSKEVTKMKIGMTYDLRQDYLNAGYSREETAEFDHPDTIDAIEKALKEMDFETDRIGNIRSLVSRLAAGERWDMVFNITEGLKGSGREAQVPALLEAYDIPYTFSDSLVSSLTLHKAMTKRVLRDLGVPTPAFHVVEKESDLEDIDIPFPLFAKPVAEGTGKGIDSHSVISCPEELEQVCGKLLETYQQPVLVEKFLPGREFTVAVLGTGNAARVPAVMEILLRKNADPEVYSCNNKENWKKKVEYRLISDDTAVMAGKYALQAWRGIGGRDAGRLDFRLDENNIPNLMEINQLAGLHPGHSDLCLMTGRAGMSYGELIGEIMSSAMIRVNIAGVTERERRWVKA